MSKVQFLPVLLKGKEMSKVFDESLSVGQIYQRHNSDWTRTVIRWREIAGIIYVKDKQTHGPDSNFVQYDCCSSDALASWGYCISEDKNE